MATNLPFPTFKSTGDDKHDMEIFEEDLKDYCMLNNWYDLSKSTEEERWIKADKAIACLRACLTPSARTVYKYSLGLSEAEQKKPHSVLQALREYYGASIGISGNGKNAESISSWESRIRNQSAQCEYESFEDELMRDQFISGLASEQLRVKLIGKGDRHKDGERAKVTLREVVEVAKTFEATTATNQLMKTARETQVYEQVNYNNNTKQKQSNRNPCFWCSGQHKQTRQRFCPAYSKRCNQCGTLGHFARACRNAGNVPGSVESRKPYMQLQQQQYANQVEVEDNYVNEELFMTDHDMNKQENARKFFAHLTVVKTNRSKVVKAQIDSSSTCNTIPVNILHQHFPNIKIEKTKAVIQTYGDQQIKPKGKVTFCCERKGKLHLLDFLVVDVPRGKPPLLSGRDAEILGYLDIHADEIHSVNEVKTDKNSNVHNQKIQNEQLNHQNSECKVQQATSRSSKIPQLGELTKEFVLEHYDKVFQPGKGNPLGAPMHIEMDPDIRPVHAPRRHIPVAKVQRVNEALEKLCEGRVIVPVTQPTNWLSNMLITEKPNGKLRICIDPSQTINKAIKRPIYTIPTIEEKLPFLTKAKVFTIVDVSEAFHNVVLDELSSLLTTFQGPNGRYRYLRMPFGISSGPEEYQRRQREFLEGLEGVINIADDICIFGCGDTDEQASKDHDKNLIALLDRCSERDLRLSAKKIQFKATSVSFMGHILTDKGVAPGPSKVIAIQEMPKPVDRNGVQRFLGMCQYLSKFCPKLSKIVLPLRDLTRINVEFIWTDVHESAFNSVKDFIASSTILQYYDVTLPVTLQVDASDEAIGGVLLQNGKPVCFTSYTLDSTERNYGQIEKECLAIVTCMSKWHQYLYGKKSILVHTDHQPLETIFRKPLTNIEFNDKPKTSIVEHVLAHVVVPEGESKVSTCDNCKDMKPEIDRIMSMFTKLQLKQDEESQRAGESEAKVESLVSEHISKMATEIESLTLQ
ncbi:Transposon Ty3-G Gag-Pol poly [Paramuricea clavata]|uniref:Transposon Ty3-G Gag-Pol poly n=1 Tax=Paramuricea clavata TaxID=317549 RepID=A0A7D9D881_PARCT|nr:Transposon Ty3-G Gag-Pol poly [Paramuricea clavata]